MRRYPTRPLLPDPDGLESGFFAADICDESNTADTGQYTTYDLTTGGTFAIGSGVATVTTDAGGAVRYCKTGNDLSSGKFLSLATVTAKTQVGAYFNCGVGLVLDGTHYLLADYDDVADNVRVGYDIGAGFVALGGITRSLTIPYQLALCSDGGTRVQIWTKTSGGVWLFATSADISTPFPWGSMTWTGWKAGFGCASPNSGASWSFDNLKASTRFR